MSVVLLCILQNCDLIYNLGDHLFLFSRLLWLPIKIPSASVYFGRSMKYLWPLNVSDLIQTASANSFEDCSRTAKWCKLYDCRIYAAWLTQLHLFDSGSRLILITHASTSGCWTRSLSRASPSCENSEQQDLQPIHLFGTYFAVKTVESFKALRSLKVNATKADFCNAVRVFLVLSRCGTLY